MPQGGSTPPCAASAVRVAPASGGCGVQKVSVGGAEGGATSAPSLPLALAAPTASAFAVTSSTTAAAAADSSASCDDDDVPVASLAPRAKNFTAPCVLVLKAFVGRSHFSAALTGRFELTLRYQRDAPAMGKQSQIIIDH
jgi:hypothetical protein